LKKQPIIGILKPAQSTNSFEAFSGFPRQALVKKTSFSKAKKELFSVALFSLQNYVF
jgi:hypothetical protein